MSIGSDETLTDPLHDALVEFTACIGNALEDICSYGLTIGETYVPFDPDPDDECDADEVQCSQAWVRVIGVNPKPEAVENWAGEDCNLTLMMALEVGVTRCIEVPEHGEAPEASDVLVAAIQAVDDMRAILCAALGCDVWDSIKTGTWTPSGPLGGQYGGVWTFDVEL